MGIIGAHNFLRKHSIITKLQSLAAISEDTTIYVDVYGSFYPQILRATFNQDFQWLAGFIKRVTAGKY